MGTLNAIYVRASDPHTISALLSKLPLAYTEADTDFYAVDQPESRFECPEVELCDLSASLRTDVIWLAFQSVVDAFEFHHWRDGKHLRSLVYGCFEQERTWERVEGSGEPWERGALFDPRHLAIALEYTTDPGERREFERIYRRQTCLPARRNRASTLGNARGKSPSISGCRDGAWRTKLRVNQPARDGRT
jgi:hypothetical protein